MLIKIRLDLSAETRPSTYIGKAGKQLADGPQIDRTEFEMVVCRNLT
jgi:hypothetical protein